MSGNDEDEALTWAGGRDPSHYETPEAKPAKVVRPSKRSASNGVAANDADAADERDDDESEDAAPATSSVVLVLLGILGGIYLLYTVGWFVSWQRFVYVASTPLDQTAFSVQQALSLVSAPVWFVVTLLLTRDRKPTVRLLWLIIGALVLVPWPFTLGV